MIQVGIQFELAQIVTFIMAIVALAFNIDWMRNHPKIWAYAFPITFILTCIILMYSTIFLARYAFVDTWSELIELDVFFTQFSSVIRTITVGTLLIDTIWKHAREKSKQERYKEYIHE